MEENTGRLWYLIGVSIIFSIFLLIIVDSKFSIIEILLSFFEKKMIRM